MEHRSHLQAESSSLSAKATQSQSPSHSIKLERPTSSNVLSHQPGSALLTAQSSQDNESGTPEGETEAMIESQIKMRVSGALKELKGAHKGHPHLAVIKALGTSFRAREEAAQRRG